MTKLKMRRGAVQFGLLIMYFGLRSPPGMDQSDAFGTELEEKREKKPKEDPHTTENHVIMQTEPNQTKPK